MTKCRGGAAVALLEAQCHRRECRYVTGGARYIFLLMPPDGFGYTKGRPKQFARTKFARPVTREFCTRCGTHLVTRRPGLPARFEFGMLDDRAFSALLKWRQQASIRSLMVWRF
jgi:hypothetical protein